MDTDPLDRLERLFREAVALPSEERAAFLDAACAGDPGLRRDLESLLEADAAPGLTGAFDDALRASVASWSESASLAPGQRVAHYRILERLGGGGMGVVYKARDTQLNRLVALKFLPPHLSMHAPAQQRFVREAQAASALDHPNICTIYEIGRTEAGQLFIAMGYYAGETLKAKLARGPLGVEEAVGIAVEIAEALGRAHEAGIVHRDVKPSNVMVVPVSSGRGSRVKLLDFGIAKVVDVDLTNTGATLGTIAYMSPEQARGEPVDHRTDLWSLGVVLYEMLTGVRPFGGVYEAAVLYAIVHGAPAPVRSLRAEVPEALEEVVEGLLRKEASARYEDAGALLADLRALGGSGGGVWGRSPVYRRARTRWKRLLAYGGLALVVLALALVGRGLLAPKARPIDSIAVLPMQNLSLDPEQEYFADGMTDLLINNLSRLSGLDRVISRTSMMRYKRTEKPLPEIGRELDVDALVEASVRSDSGRVIITVNLIDPQTEGALWGHRYERPLRDVLKLQSEIALAITEEIAVALTPREEALLAQTREVDPEAHRLFIRGVQARYRDRPEDLLNAVSYLEQAIDLDRGFAPAYAWLATSYTVLGAFVGGFITQEEAAARARKAAEQARTLDPDLSEVHLALGLIREIFDRDWSGAEDAFRQAIALNPGNSEAHRELGLLLMRMRRFEEAQAQIRRAVDLDPLSLPAHTSLAEVYYMGGRFDEAVEQARHTLALDSTFAFVRWILGGAYMRQGRPEAALKEYEKARGAINLGWIGHAYGAAGRPARARQVRDELLAQWQRRQPGAAFGLGLTYAGLGEHEPALDWLERSYEAREGMIIDINAFVLDPLRLEPRFRMLLEKMGLK